MNDATAAERLRRAREARGVSPAETAEASGVAAVSLLRRRCLVVTGVVAGALVVTGDAEASTGDADASASSGADDRDLLGRPRSQTRVRLLDGSRRAGVTADVDLHVVVDAGWPAPPAAGAS